MPKTWIKSINGTNKLADVYWPPFGDLALQKAQTDGLEPEPGTWELMTKVRVIAAAGEFLIRPFKCYVMHLQLTICVHVVSVKFG